MGRHLKFDPEMEGKIKEAIAAGECLNSICADLGTSAHKVRVVARRHGMVIRTGHVKNRSFRILYLLLSGQEYTEVARILGVTRQRVDQVRRLAEDAGFAMGPPRKKRNKHVA